MTDIEQDTRESRVIGEYLDLVNRHGTSAAPVRLFLDVHASSPGLLEWVATVERWDESRGTGQWWLVFFSVITAVLITLALVVVALLMARGVEVL